MLHTCILYICICQIDVPLPYLYYRVIPRRSKIIPSYDRELIFFPRSLSILRRYIPESDAITLGLNIPRYVQRIINLNSFPSS